jgi:hypothetical protein
VTFTTPPPIPTLPTSTTNPLAWIVRAATAINGLLRGKANTSFTVTLAPSAVSTTIYDSRIGLTSFIGLQPQTAHAQTALLAGIYVVPGAAQATINHASNAASDQTFAGCILG